MANLKNVIYLSNEDYETLVSTGTVTIDGETLTYDENNVYITPDKLASTTEDGLMSSSDKVKLDNLPAGDDLITTKEDFSNQVFLDNESSLTILRKECYLIKQGDSVKIHIYISGKNESGAQVNNVRFSNTSTSTLTISNSEIANAITDMNGNAISSATAGQLKPMAQIWYNDGNTTIQTLRAEHRTTNQIYLYSERYSPNIPDSANFIVCIDEVLAV